MYQIFIALSSLFIVYVSIYLFTKKSRYIKIMKKYKTNNIMKVIDDENIEYLIDENLFISEKRCIEIFDNLVENYYNYITFYGLNYPNLGIKYRII